MPVESDRRVEFEMMIPNKVTAVFSILRPQMLLSQLGNEAVFVLLQLAHLELDRCLCHECMRTFLSYMPANENTMPNEAKTIGQPRSLKAAEASLWTSKASLQSWSLAWVFHDRDHAYVRIFSYSTLPLLCLGHPLCRANKHLPSFSQVSHIP